jgi:hypothetical protein
VEGKIIEMGSGFPPNNLSGAEVVTWLHNNNCIVTMPYDGGRAFNDFVSIHSKALRRIG